MFDNWSEGKKSFGLGVVPGVFVMGGLSIFGANMNGNSTLATAFAGAALLLGAGAYGMAKDLVNINPMKFLAGVAAPLMLMGGCTSLFNSCSNNNTQAARAPMTQEAQQEAQLQQLRLSQMEQIRLQAAHDRGMNVPQNQQYAAQNQQYAAQPQGQFNAQLPQNNAAGPQAQKPSEFQVPSSEFLNGGANTGAGNPAYRITPGIPAAPAVPAKPGAQLQPLEPLPSLDPL